MLPTILLAVLIIYNATLDGSGEGVEAYIGHWCALASMLRMHAGHSFVGCTCVAATFILQICSHLSWTSHLHPLHSSKCC